MKIVKITDHFDVYSWDVIYGINGRDDTWILFDHPVTVTSSPHPDDPESNVIYGVMNGRPYNVTIDRGDTDVLVEVS